MMLDAFIAGFIGGFTAVLTIIGAIAWYFRDKLKALRRLL